jgi:acyl carrier protein
MSVDINSFIENFRNAVDFQNPADVQPTTELAQLPEWDSLAALGIIVMFDMEYGVTITGEDLKAMSTVDNLYHLLSSKMSN